MAVFLGGALTWKEAAVASPGERTTAPLYSVGVTPQFDPSQLYAIWRPVLDALEKESELRFTLRTPGPIPVFEQAYDQGSFDFAYVNPYLVGVKNPQGYLPLIRDHNANLTGVVVVRKDSPIRSKEQLDGQVVAFPASKALAGSLIIRAELEQLHGIQVKPRYVGSHDSAFLNAVLGETAAAGGVMTTFARQRPEVREQLQIIYRTQEVKALPFVAHPRIPAEIQQRVAEAFQRLSERADGQALLAKIPISQVGPASMADYAPLKKLNLERYEN